jgi:hypothetical protein
MRVTEEFDGSLWGRSLLTEPSKREGDKMWRKTVMILCSILLIATLPDISPLASAKADSTEQRAAKVKAAISKLGAGRAARVEVDLRDSSKIVGYVSQVGEDQFVVVDANTNASVAIPYPNVKKLQIQNSAFGKTVALGLAGHLRARALIILGVLLVVVVVLVASDKS